MRNVSVFLLTYGHFEYTKVALDCLIENRDSSRLTELIILDTLPAPWNQDETQEQLEQIQQRGYGDFSPHNIKVIFLDKNYGSPWTIKKGIESCNSQNDVFFCSNDVFLGHNWLEPLVEVAYKDDWHTQYVACVSPFQSPEYEWDEFINAEFRKQYIDGLYRYMIHEKDSSKILAGLHQLYEGNFVEFSKRFVQRNKGKVWDDLNYCCFLLKRDILDKGMFWDDRYSLLHDGGTTGYGSDDHDFSIQLDNAGYFRLTAFESFAHHLICGTNRKITLDDPEKNRKDIQSGNRFFMKWERDYTLPEIVYPFDLAPGIPRAHHKHRWKLRETPLPNNIDVYKVDLGVGREILNCRIND